MKALKQAIVFGALTLGVFLKPALASETNNSLIFGVVPQQSASRLAKIWTPFLNHLSHDLDQPIIFATAKDIPTFEACLSKGAYDISYMNPYHYTTFHAQTGYTAFARQENKKLKGLLVVRSDSPVQSLEDLRGATLAFPSPAAFGASVIPRAELARLGIDFQPRYVRSHDSVYRAVVAGLMPAGGGVLRTFGTIPDELKVQLRVLYRTEAYTPHAFAAHPRVRQSDLDIIRSRMIETKQKRPDLMSQLGMPGVQAASDGDWDDVRALGLTQRQTSVVLEETGKCRSG